MSHRPHIINQFSNIVGSEIADKIACDFAGCTLYISTQKNSELVACVGFGNAQKLQQHFGNVAVDIPLGTNATFVLKKQTFFNLLAMGYTVHKAQQMVGHCPPYRLVLETRISHSGWA